MSRVLDIAAPGVISRIPQGLSLEYEGECNVLCFEACASICISSGEGEFQMFVPDDNSIPDVGVCD